MKKEILKEQINKLNKDCLIIINSISFDGFYEYVQHCLSIDEINKLSNELVSKYHVFK